ncbi:selenide, water dikinase SelD [Paraliomyxa miuraensis]|uniref:selenide, water dikinase SelD n=1 Tax=Paraliomyxa miuraensis TaxID=376150 RepID=UPI00224C8A6C|nr:selenide, water dikinase SelD [Paraliomyxa miuraensis]MCX4246554.1 selenide, water dikinase SelD [Paraliomyxa miuraensis]
MAIRLTKTAKRAGCAAKQPPGYLFPLLQRLPPVTDPQVLVGSATADDAAVYRLDDERALVLTTDFFTPIVDDPYDFGAVAAANALSDVYAMGGRPLTALNLVGFPAELEVEILGEILRGGAEKAREAGIDLVGGHTIKSEEPIYGLAVTGLVHPQRVVSNAGGRPGDRLILTKPIGTGIVTTAAKNDEDSLGAIGDAIAVMATLNRAAAEAMIAVGVGEAGVHAATDITGFGLLGHLRNIVRASGCGAVIERARVPVLEAALTYVGQGIAPGGTHANRRFLAESVAWGEGLQEADELLLCDAQTSGGLLIAVASERSEALMSALHERGVQHATCVGELCEAPLGPKPIAVR